MYEKQSPPPSPPPGLASVRNVSPLPSPTPNRTEKRSAAAKQLKFLRRLVYFRHMDFEFALWQMLYLLISPQKVYRNFQYRKQIKDQFARDDPAFVALLSLWLLGSSVGFAFVLRLGFVGFVKFLLWVIFIDCIGIGLMVATVLWLLSNRYLRKPACQDQDVEWGYAFDVHLNAFFPPLFILHVFQLLFYHVLISHEWFISRMFGNTLWLLAMCYYIYITFLGYSALPILQRTQTFLYPLLAIFLLYLVTLIGGWNLCRLLVNFYCYRIL